LAPQFYILVTCSVVAWFYCGVCNTAMSCLSLVIFEFYGRFHLWKWPLSLQVLLPQHLAQVTEQQMLSSVEPCQANELLETARVGCWQVPYCKHCIPWHWRFPMLRVIRVLSQPRQVLGVSWSSKSLHLSHWIRCIAFWHWQWPALVSLRDSTSFVLRIVTHLSFRFFSWRHRIVVSVDFLHSEVAESGGLADALSTWWSLHECMIEDARRSALACAIKVRLAYFVYNLHAGFYFILESSVWR